MAADGERAGRLLTVGITSDRHGTDVRITVAGVPVELDFRQSRPATGSLRLTDDRGRVLEERISLEETRGGQQAA
jgi:hypothetical protein